MLEKKLCSEYLRWYILKKRGSTVIQKPKTELTELHQSLPASYPSDLARIAGPPSASHRLVTALVLQ